MYRSAVVIVLDRIGSAYLGPYGNTWLDSPAMNRLASQSRLFENAISDSPSLEQAYRSYWSGVPALCNVIEDERAQPNFIDQLNEAGVRATLITDSRWLNAHDDCPEFADRIDMASGLSETIAPDAARTQVGQMFAAAADWIDQAGDRSLLWLHAAAAEGCWDAPHALRDQFTEEGDPPPLDSVSPPEMQLDSPADPDQVLAVTHAYAGQIAALDACLAAFLRKFEQLPEAQQPLLILTSPRGFPLGGHGWIGAGGDDLYSETAQVPLLIRSPGQTTAGERISNLVQPSDLYATLVEFFEIASTDSAPAWGRNLLATSRDLAADTREFVCGVNGGDWSLRTPIWFLRTSSGPPQLFVKPDDHWEVNEIASRCADVVEELQTALHQVRKAGKAGDPKLLPTLAEELKGEGVMDG